MKYTIGKSFNKVCERAVNEATQEINKPKLLLFFGQAEKLEEYSKELKKRFEDSILIGSSTFAGFCKDGAFKDGILILAIEDGIECYGNVLEDVDKYPLKYIDRINECVSKFKDTENTICFEISSALKKSEELVLSTFNSILKEKGIPLFGGSSGDRGKAERTLISFNGEIYENGCAFVILKNLGGKIRLYRENIYKKTKHVFIATKVDARNRTVYEYDDKPAAEVMAQALNTTIKELPKYLDSYPWGRLIGNEMYIVANNMIVKNKGISCHARIYKNSKMVLLEPDNYREVIKNTIENVKKDIKKPSLSIMVNCLARSILFESDGYLNEFAKEMSYALGNYVGFAGYGEQLGEEHFNQTMVLAVFE